MRYSTSGFGLCIPVTCVTESRSASSATVNGGELFLESDTDFADIFFEAKGLLMAS